MRKKIFAVILLLSLCVSLFGCENTPAETDPVLSATGENTDTQAPTQEPTEPPTEPVTLPPEEPYSMGDIYIQSEKALSDEYQQATVRIDFGKNSIEEQTVRIKHRGNLSLNYAEKKSYNIKFESKVSFLGMENGKKWSLLADPFDKSLLRPILAMEYAAAIGIDVTSQTRLCRVWLNGKYQGVYTALEPVDDGKRGVDINMDNGDFLFERNFNSNRTEEGITYFTTDFGMRFELNAPEVPTDTQLSQIVSKVNAIEAVIRTKDSTSMTLLYRA